jgi:hypothetical protein
MLLEDYWPVAWTSGRIEAITALWSERIPDRSCSAFSKRKHWGGRSDDLLIDARTSCDLFKWCV